MKQLPIVFEQDFANSSWGFRNKRLDNGDYISNRTIQVSFMPWDCGYMMYVKVLEQYSNKTTHVTTRTISEAYYHDMDFSAPLRNRLVAMADVRGKTAEGMASDLFMDICGMDVYKEFFPTAYEEIVKISKRKTK